MAYQFEDIETSQKIFYYLLQHGSIEEATQTELFRAYAENEEILNLVKSQGRVAACQIERYGSVIYLIPDIDNTFLGYTKRELKSELCRSNATDRDYYLAQFIILTLLAEFYDGQGGHCKSRDMIKIGVLQNEVSDRLKEGLKAEEETEEQGEPVSSGLDYRSMCQAFEALKSGERDSRTKTTKEGVMNSVMSFLERQGLIIYIQQDEMIKTTKKLDDIMEMKLLNKANYQRMMQSMGVQIDE